VALPLSTCPIPLWYRRIHRAFSVDHALVTRPRAIAHHRGSIVLGHGVTVRSDLKSNPISQGLPSVISTVTPAARLVIEDGVGISSAVIAAADEIVIGRGTAVGVGCLITDWDFHPLCPDCREENRAVSTRPIRIGARCFLGARAIILKGVVLGEGCVVGAGSVVTSGSYPAGSVLVGAPAKVVGDSRCSEHPG